MSETSRSTGAFSRLILRTAGLSNASDDTPKHRICQEMSYALSIQDDTMEGMSEKSPAFAAAIATVGCCLRLMDFAKGVPPEETLSRILDSREASLELIRSTATYLSAVVDAAEKEKRNAA